MPGAGPMPGVGPMPGAGPMPGVGPGGAAPGGQGVAQSPQSPAGTAEFSAESIVIQALKGDITGLEQFISPKCKGVLGDIRDGKATERQIEDLKKLFTGIKPVSVRNENGTKVLTISNADNLNITFRVKKEGQDFKVIEMTTKQASTKKSR